MSTESQLRLIFVDDEPLVLQGLRRTLHSMRGEWQMEFANSGAEALQMMAKAPFDVLVTDMRMPGMKDLNSCSESKLFILRPSVSSYRDSPAGNPCSAPLLPVTSSCPSPARSRN